MLSVLALCRVDSRGVGGGTSVGGDLLKIRSTATKPIGPVPSRTHTTSSFHIGPEALCIRITWGLAEI